MKNERYIELIAAALILLFVYAAISKVADFASFTIQLRQQPFPDLITPVLVWGLPVAELLASFLLAFKGTRLAGLYLALLLMTVFTGYVMLVLLRVFDGIPCFCGGVLNSLGWREHFGFNVLFTLLALAGIVLSKRKQEACKQISDLEALRESKPK